MTDRERKERQLLSSASDMARYTSFQLGAGRTAIPSGRARDSAWQGSMPTGRNGSAYNMGWLHRTEYGKNLVWHAGEPEGASSAVVLMPERQLGLVILAGARSTLPEAIAGRPPAA